MGEYQNGRETRSKILDACRVLFYEKGYEKTTFKEICKYLGINQSAIHYHFRTKDNLVQILLKETISKNNTIVESCSDSATTPLTKMLFSLKIYLYKIMKDEKYRKFYISATQNFYKSAFMEMVHGIYFDFTMQERDAEETVLEELACSGFDQSTLLYIDENIEHLSLEEVFSEVIEMYRRILQISDSDLACSLEQIRTLDGRCDWEHLDTTL